VFAVWFIEPHVVRLSFTLGVGFSEGAPTPETTRFAADLERLRVVENSFGLILLLVILAGGLPLAAIAIIANASPRLFGPLIRNAAVLWICMTMQLTNVMLPSFFILMFATMGLDPEMLMPILIATLYAVVNFLAARTWRRLLNRVHVSSFERASGATL
jgi:hypothetical protein